jgi:hypothetical protein
MGFAVSRIIPAQNVVATDYDEAAAKGAGLYFAPGGVAHQEVAPIGRGN